MFSATERNTHAMLQQQTNKQTEQTNKQTNKQSKQMQHFLRDNVYPQAHTLTDGRSRGGNCSASTKSFDSEKKSNIKNSIQKKSNITNSNFQMVKTKSWQNNNMFIHQEMLCANIIETFIT